MVSERRAALTALTRKYGETIDEVLAWGQQASLRLLDLDGTDERIEQLRGEQEQLRAELAEAAGRLSAARTASAARLADEVTAELTLLAMPHARLAIEVRQGEVPAPAPDAPRPAGRCGSAPGGCATRPRASTRSSCCSPPNTGSEPRPLGKGASGGELSRVMLAVEVALAGTSPVPTFVFDEVDAGVGGTAAVEIGRRLARLAHGAQVLVVTHLPQVAAYADRHVVVEKSHDGTVTSSGLTVLDDAPARAGALPDAGRPDRLRHGAGARPRAARRRPARPRPGLSAHGADRADAPGPGRCAGGRSPAGRIERS